MSRVDIDELMQLWREEPTDRELEAVREDARRAMRRARLVTYAEHGIAALVIAAILLSLVLKGAPASMAIGALTILVIVWSTWRRGKLLEAAALTRLGHRRRFLEEGLRSARTRLRRSRLGLVLLVPSALLGALLKHSLATGGDVAGFFRLFADSLIAGGSALKVTALVALALLWFGTLHVRLRAEVRRIEALREQYRVEDELDGVDHS